MACPSESNLPGDEFAGLIGIVFALQEITEQDEDEREGEANSREENAANDLAQ